MLQVTDLICERGDRVILDGATFNIHVGHKVGVVGRNGAGKSTLFALIRRRLTPSSGDVEWPRHWRVAHLSQEIVPSQRSALDFVLDGDQELRSVQARLVHAEANGADVELAELHSEFDDVGGYTAQARAGEILHGLGFAAGEFDKNFVAFSGGGRIRLGLAQALMTPAELLLLDEPTNHLDLDATLWLEQWLKRFTGTLLIISHDRTFLDTVTDHTLHLHQRHATLYKGNYSSFEEQRAMQLVLQQANYRKQQKHIEHINGFVRRFRAKATKAKQVQSRLKALERLEKVAPVHADSPYQFSFENPTKMSTPLLSTRDLAIGYDGVPVLKGISQTLLPGDRIGVLGANGAGKTTLLRCIVGELKALEGDIVRGQHARVGYFAQHQLETLNRDRSALAELLHHHDQREQHARDYLGRWGFDGAHMSASIHTLSGGEKARLVLALIARQSPALLVLDEPTNHLDLDMRDALAVALQDFTGALLVVSHDRSVLERTVDQFWLVADQTVTRFDDTLDRYGVMSPSSQPRSKKRRNQRGRTTKRAKIQQPLVQQIKHHEQKIAKLTRDLKPIEAQLADAQTYTSLAPDDLDALLRKSAKLRKKLDDAEHAWLTCSEELENLEPG